MFACSEYGNITLKKQNMNRTRGNKSTNKHSVDSIRNSGNLKWVSMICNYMREMTDKFYLCNIRDTKHSPKWFTAVVSNWKKIHSYRRKYQLFLWLYSFQCQALCTWVMFRTECYKGTLNVYSVLGTPTIYLHHDFLLLHVHSIVTLNTDVYRVHYGYIYPLHKKFIFFMENMRNKNEESEKRYAQWKKSNNKIQNIRHYRYWSHILHTNIIGVTEIDGHIEDIENRFKSLNEWVIINCSKKM